MNSKLLSNQLLQALQQVGWVDKALAEIPPANPGAEPCLLRILLALETLRPFLRRDGATRLSQLVDSGWTLRSAWPRAWSDCVDNWLGSRFFFMHASQLARTTQVTSIVSSQLGRYGRGLPQWPRLIESALRYAKRDNSRLLLCPGTTLAESVEQYCLTTGVPSLKAVWNEKFTFAQWFSSLITKDTLVANRMAAHDHIFISPATRERCQALRETPLQDRVAIGLADRVFSFKIRPGGNLEKLVEARLIENCFPSGTLFVALEHSLCPGDPKSSARWLSRGAVGWILQDDRHYQNSNMARCRSAAGALPWPHQISSPLPAIWRELKEQDSWPYLVHCTRGLSGPLPDESIESFRNRLWTSGDSIDEQPLETLARICREQRLRATSTLTRTDARCVSFSSVPLLPLLRRRKFQSHLKRWDWEPYGLAIRRDALRAMGAQPVIYGGQSDFAELDRELQPFFQPAQRENPSTESWAAECEWRIIDDVRLSNLPPASVLVFVRTRSEAQQLARHSPWPALWVESS